MIEALKEFWNNMPPFNMELFLWIAGFGLVLGIITYILYKKQIIFVGSLKVGDAVMYQGHEGEILELYEGTDEVGPMALIKTEVPQMKLTKLKQ